MAYFASVCAVSARGNLDVSTCEGHDQGRETHVQPAESEDAGGLPAMPKHKQEVTRGIRYRDYWTGNSFTQDRYYSEDVITIVGTLAGFISDRIR